jgi:predicted PurR-regulated permease PerM
MTVSENSTLGRLKEMAEDLFAGTSTEQREELAEAADEIEEDLTAKPDEQTVIVAREENTTLATAAAGLVALVTPLAIAALVVVLAIFLLLQREDMRDRVFSLAGDDSLAGTTRLMQDATARVSRYLFNLLVVNALFGIWFGVGLWLLGVPYAPLWGLFTALFRFIPFVGSPVSVALPLLMSIASSTGWTQPLLVLAFFVVSEFVTANFIEPVVFGKSTGLSPLALLAAALFWGWIWGAIGLLLTTPLTVCLVVLGMHIPALRWLKVLLAEQPPLKARHQYFQRMLANDRAGARRVLDSYAAGHGMDAALDEVVLPAIQLTRRERAAENILANEETEIWQGNTALLAELENSEAEAETAENDDESAATDGLSQRQHLIYGYPVHHVSEELALAMLRQTVRTIARFAVCSTRTLPRKALQEIAETRPSAVVLAVIRPGGLPQLRHMCGNLRDRCPEIPVIVMHLSEIPDYDDMLVDLRELGVEFLTTTLRQTASHIKALINNGNGSARSAAPRPSSREASEQPAGPRADSNGGRSGFVQTPGS